MNKIKIKDYYGNYLEVPVSNKMYTEWLKLQNESQRVFHLERRHRSRCPLEDTDVSVSANVFDSLDDDCIRNEADRELYEAIKKLTPTQKRRIHMLLDGITLWQLTEYEHCSYNAVKSSVLAALKHLKKLLGDRCNF